MDDRDARDRDAEARRALRRFALWGAEGAAAGLALMLGLLWTGVGGVDALIDRAPSGWVALLMLAAAFGTTGGAIGVGVGAASMRVDR